MSDPAPFLDWLYSDSEKQGGLILFPRMIDRWNIASIIVSTWDRFRVVVVTDHPDDFMQTIIETPLSSLRGSYQMNWKHVDGIPFPLLKYSQLDDINRALHNTEIDIIVFDDARLLAMIAPALDFQEVKPRIIVLTSWGDTQPQLTMITSHLNLQLLAINLVSDTASIDWQYVAVPMSTRQVAYYSQIHDTSPHLTRSRMVSLYTYPDAIMNDTLAHQSICETDQTSQPDRLSDTSWLNSNYLTTLREDGPKLEALLDGIISHWPTKQIVLTRFNHRYGVDLITSMLELLGMNQQNPYEMDQIYHIACTDVYEETINRLHRFNQAESGVLVTNIVPLIPLQGVSIIHVVDTYAFPTLIALIDRCHKRYLTQTGLTICSYLATLPEGTSVDETLYLKLLQDITAIDQLYTGLLNTSQRLVYDPSRGLLVL